MIYEDFVNEEFTPFLIKKEKYPEHSLSNIKRNVLPIIGNIELEAIQPADIEKILGEMYRKSYTTAKIINTYIFTKLSFKLAISRDLIHRNPCIMNIHVITGKRYTFPEDLETHRKIVSSIDKLPLRNLFGFSYMTGFSIKQLFLLHRDDYDRDGHLLTIKTEQIKGKYRIPDCALPYIEAELEKQDRLPYVEDNLLFADDDGSQIKRTLVTFSAHLLKNYLRKPDFTARDLSRAHGNMLQLTGGDDWS